MSELKRCPFCGGEALLRGFFLVQCIKCGVSTLTYLTEIDAIKAWNTRKPMDRIVERLEHLLKNFGEHCENQGEECTHKSCSDCVLSHGIEIVKEEGGINR